MGPLDDELGQLYAQALIAIARVDGKIGPEEGKRLRELVAARTSVPIDHEASFFQDVLAGGLAAAVTRRSFGAYRDAGSTVTPRELGRALVADAVELAAADGGPDAAEARAILRYAYALECTPEDIRAVTDQLDEWLR